MLIGLLFSVRAVTQIIGLMFQHSYVKASLFVISIPITISPIILVIIVQPIALLAIQVLIGLSFFVTVVSQPLGMML